MLGASEVAGAVEALFLRHESLAANCAFTNRAPVWYTSPRVKSERKSVVGCSEGVVRRTAQDEST